MTQDNRDGAQRTVGKFTLDGFQAAVLKQINVTPEEYAEAISGDKPKVKTTLASEVVTKPVEWLWYRRIPKAKLTMFDGDPDVGKSVITIDIAARVSTGRGFADGSPCEAGNVLIVNVEDAKDDTIVPRLKAHGADLDRIRIIDGMPDGKGGTRLLDLPGDVAALEEAVEEFEAVLLIVDPVITMLGGDINKDQDARKALAPLRDMAERTGVSIVAVRHLNKNVSLSAIQRGGGNMGLIGVARAGAFFAWHPDEEGLRIMAQHKSNLAEKPPSLQFKVVPWAIDPNIGRIEWCGESDHDANSLAAEGRSSEDKSAIDEAKEFLQAELGDGPMWVKQVFRDADQAGIAIGTLKRAKAALRVKSEKIGVDGWQWYLPDKPHRGPVEEDHDQTVEIVEPLDPLQNADSKSKPESAYIKEGSQEDQESQGSQAEHVEPVHDHLQTDKRHSSSLADSAPGKAREDMTLLGDDDDDNVVVF